MAGKRKTKRGPDPVDVNAGQALRTFRIWRGMSQAELADGLGITFQQVQKYERGANRMAASTLYKASRILDIAIEEFFAGLDGHRPNACHSLLSREEIEILRIYRQVSDRVHRKFFREIIKLIAGCGVIR